MITIGICDDNPQHVELLVTYIKKIPGADAFYITKSTDPEEFLNMVQNHKPQLVFLDIDMGQMSGIRLGEKIKELYENTLLIYITAYEKFAVDAFSVRAFHYLLKPLTRDRFIEIFEEALDNVEKIVDEEEKMFFVKTKKEVITLSLKEIFYFEKIGHKIKIHTEKCDYFYYDNFRNLLKTISADSFIQCHQGYIANLSKTRGFHEKTLFLSNKIQLPVSRTFADSVKEMLAERLFAGKDTR